MSLESRFLMSQEIDFLFAQAREGKLTPLEFCKALNRFGFDHTQRMLYVRNIFGLPLEQAKKVLLEADGRSIETWTEEMEDVISELPSNLKDPDDASETR